MGKYLGDRSKKPAITPLEWATLYQIHVFDVSKSAETYQTDQIQIQDKFEFIANAVATMNCYTLTLTDGIVEFSSDGSRMVIV